MKYAAALLTLLKAAFAGILLLVSLNMLIETRGGRDYTFNDFDTCVHAVVFKKADWIQFAGPTSAAVAYK